MSQSSPQADTPIIAGDAAVLARRYAGALYELAEEQKQLDAVAADLRALRNLHQESAEFRLVTSHPRLTRAQLIEAVDQVSQSAKFNKLTASFLSLIAKNRRLPVLRPMIDTFLAQLAASRGEHTAEIRSARPLTPAQQEQLAAKLREMSGGKVHLSMHEDASLLGGIVVKMGSHLIDASIKTKLARLERQLKTQQFNTQKGAA